jgi:hypothetical protein
MKKSFILIAYAAIAFLQVSLVQAKNEVHLTADSLTDDPLSGIFNAYLSVKNSLAKGDEDEAGTKGKILYNLLDGLSMDKATQEQYDVWMKYSKKLLNDADHIAEMPHLEHQRDHFAKLSKNLFEVIKVFKTNTNDIYYHYCLEAHDGKGAYWLSEQEKSNNPYMGDKIPECDSIKEIIKGKT